MEAKEFLAKIAGKTAEEQAKMLADFMADNRRKKTVEAARRETRGACFGDAKKLSKSQQESYLYDYLAANSKHVNQWLREEYPGLFSGINTKVNNTGVNNNVKQGTYVKNN